jgi:3-ketosteroid 9alpha-monooxygenase subunit B
MIRPKALTTVVSRVVRETADTVTLRLDLKGQAFEYRPGMAVNIDPRQFPRLADEIRRREEASGRPETPRSFSLASTPLENGSIELTIKVEAGGEAPPLLSSFLVHELREGEPLQILGPFGRYVLPDPLDPAIEAALYISAGSGASPNRGILRHGLKAGRPARHLFFMQNKTSADIIYRRELEDLRAAHPDRLRVVHVLSRERVEGMEHGHVNLELLRRELESFGPVERAIAFVCGPNRPRPGHARGFVDSFAGSPKTSERGILGECGFPFERIVREIW